MEQNILEKKHLSEEMEMILDHLPSVVVYKDTKNNFIHVNKFTADAQNMTKEEMIGKSCFDLYPEEEAQAYWNDDLEVINSRKPKLNIVEPWETKGGTRWVITSKVPHFDVNGNVKGIIALTTDITEQKMAEYKLRVSEHDLGERVKELNCLYGISQLVEKTEISFEEIIRGTLELIPPAWQFPEVTCARITFDEKLFRTENFKETEWKLTTQVEVNEKPMEIEVYYLEDNPFLKEETNLINDLGKRLKVIFEHMEAEQKLKESEEKFKKLNLELEQRIEERTSDLKESEKKFKTISEQSLMGICILQDDSIKYANQTLSKICGYSIEEMKNWDPGDFTKILHPDDKEMVLKQAFKKQRGLSDVENWYQFRGIKKTGEMIWVENLSNTILYEGKTADLITIIDITERKKMEENLRNSEELFRDFFDSATIGFHIFGPDRIITKMNEYELNLLGYSREEIVDKKTWYDLITPEQRHQFEKHWNEILNKGSVNNLEYTLIHKDGHFIDVLLNASSRFDDNDNLINTRGSVLNITNRKKAEGALKNSEFNLRNRVKELTCLYELSKLVESPNISLEEVLQRTLDLIPPAWQFPEITCARISYNGQEFKTKYFMETDWKLKTDIKRRDQTVGIIEVYDLKSKPMFDEAPFLKEERNLINALAEILGRYIERKMAEQKLKESEEKYRELYENAPNAYFSVKPDKTIMSCNQAALELLGYNKKEILNMKVFDLYYNSPEGLQKAKRLFKQFLEGKNIQDVEIQMKHKNGNPFWVSLSVKTVRNQKGQVVESRSIVINITARKRTEELIIEENKKLAELNKIKKNLIIRVSHELKTPLNSIYGAIQILMNFYRDRMDKEILEFNNIIYKGCIRLKKLIEDLLDISKLDHSKIILRKKKENIINTLMSCASEINHMATQRNLNIIIDLPKVLFIDFDKIRIEQVFINILSNAIKFTPPNGSIFISLKENYKNIEIYVKDTGIGLTKGERKLLFKRFGKIERYGKQMDVDIEGSGLGLYIAKQIIELHGGDIIVESGGRNKGSTFTIRLNK